MNALGACGSEAENTTMLDCGKSEDALPLSGSGTSLRVLPQRVEDTGVSGCLIIGRWKLVEFGVLLGRACEPELR